MNHIIANTYSVVGNLCNSIPVDTIAVRIQPITGDYKDLAGCLIEGSYEIFHTLLHEQIKLHPPKNGDCLLIKQPHDSGRTFDNVLYIADDESLPLSTFTERLLNKLVEYGCSTIAIPLLRYHPQSAKGTTNKMLRGIRHFQESHKKALRIYVTLSKLDSSGISLIFDETDYRGDWSDGRPHMTRDNS